MSRRTLLDSEAPPSLAFGDRAQIVAYRHGPFLMGQATTGHEIENEIRHSADPGSFSLT